MLTITRDLHDKIVAHARADHPDEACGVIAGPAGSDRPERFIAMDNAERSPTFYRFDSAEQFRVWREMDDNDEEPVVIYHSPHGHRGVPEPDRHLLRQRAAGPLRPGLDQGRRRDGVPLVPDPGGRRDRGAGDRGGMIPSPQGLDAKGPTR